MKKITNYRLAHARLELAEELEAAGVAIPPAISSRIKGEYRAATAEIVAPEGDEADMDRELCDFLGDDEGNET